MTFLGFVWLIAKVLYFLGCAVLGLLLADATVNKGPRLVEITHPVGEYEGVQILANVVAIPFWPLILLASLRITVRL